MLGHLDELRGRLLWALAAWLTGCLAVWTRAPRIVDWLLRPLGAPAVFLSPAEAFRVVFQADMAAGAVLALPVILWQALGFLLPAMTVRERRLVGGMSVFSVVVFALGMWFGWVVLVPATMKFLMSFATELLRPQITASSYLSLVFWVVLGCGVAAEFPVLTMGLAAAGLVRARTLLRHWRGAILGCTVLAALMTPSPDAGTMLMVMVPLIGLYFLGAATAALAGG